MVPLCLAGAVHDAAGVPLLLRVLGDRQVGPGGEASGRPSKRNTCARRPASASTRRRRTDRRLDGAPPRRGVFMSGASTLRPGSTCADGAGERSTSSSRWLTRIIGIAKRSRRLVDQRQQLLAPRRVERRQRLVEQQRARTAHQRAADGDALLLAAGKLRRAAVEQRRRCRAARRLRRSRSAPRPTRARRSADSPPRNNAGTGAAPGTRSRAAAAAAADSRRRAESNSTVPPMAMRPSSGVSSPATMLSSVVLPPPEGPTSASVGAATRMSASTVVVPSVRRTRISITAPRAPKPRASASEAASATTAMAIATDRQPPCARRAVGVLRGVVDRGRERLRLAGNIGDESDGGAELADRLGEAEDEPAPSRRAARAAA